STPTSSRCPRAPPARTYRLTCTLGSPLSVAFGRSGSRDPNITEARGGRGKRQVSAVPSSGVILLQETHQGRRTHYALPSERPRGAATHARPRSRLRGGRRHGSSDVDALFHPKSLVAAHGTVQLIVALLEGHRQL